MGAWRFSLAARPLSERFLPLVLMRGRNLSLTRLSVSVFCHPWWGIWVRGGFRSLRGPSVSVFCHSYGCVAEISH
ncbi:hypothetical protein BHAP_0709 [Bifidobacterium hapali]|uniref:Uncharacterized protein n=1 Tax=Bifidobacterium hapali TaxID=1630172 RepID=A0A261G1U1_9BIFI|nr:hypothetical protein BHAP_0709 [Bifidobacterium hapali]